MEGIQANKLGVKIIDAESSQKLEELVNDWLRTEMKDVLFINYVKDSAMIIYHEDLKAGDPNIAKQPVDDGSAGES